MKLNPPAIEIEDDNPFRYALYERQKFADALTSILRKSKRNTVFFVHAPWGEGKTTFAKMWRTKLRVHDKQPQIIYFDAFAADSSEDPFISFTAEILAMVDKELTEYSGIIDRKNEFKKSAIKLGAQLSSVAFKAGVHALSAGLLDPQALKQISKVASDSVTQVDKGFADIGAKIIEDRIKNYSAEKNTFTAFKDNLGKLAKAIQEERGFPLTIFVDELDRCRPDFALGLLERIKHLFDVDGVAFVLFINRHQLESYIRCIYGTDTDAHSYLLKFCSLFVDLPSKYSHGLSEQDHGTAAFTKQVLDFYTLDLKNPILVINDIDILAYHFDLSLREIQKSVMSIANLLASIPNAQDTDWIDRSLVVLLAILKVKIPNIYDRLRDDKMRSDVFFESTRIDDIADLLTLPRFANFEPTYILLLIKYILATNDELAVLLTRDSEKDAVQGHQKTCELYNFSRRQWLRNHISHLDRLVHLS